MLRVSRQKLISACILISVVFLPSRSFGAPGLLRAFTGIEVFAGFGLIQTLLALILSNLFGALATFCLLVLLRVLLKSQIASIVVCVLFLTMALGSGWGYAAGLFYGALWLFILMRFGFVAALLAPIGSRIILTSPATLDASAWYADTGYLALAIFAAIVLYAFRTSLGGRPLFGTPRLDD